MGKEKRAARADGGANYGDTPYDRPSGRGGRAIGAEGEGTGMAGQGGIQASSNSLQAVAGRESSDRAAQTSMWRSLVATPMKALKSTYNLLSGSPNQEAGAEQQHGLPAVPQEASSTATVLANGPQENEDRAANGDSIHLDHDMRSPSPPQGVSPAASGAPADGDRASSYDDLRAQSASLMVKTPISSSPFLKRQRPGSAQAPGLQLSGLSTPSPGRLSLGPGNLSRFAQLESMPAAPPLALTPIARPPRSVPRARRPFSRTPVRLPLAVDSSEIPPSSAPQHEPAPLAWTPMRAQAMTPQTGGFRAFGVKRMREGEGTPGTLGTPLLQAGQASEAVRRTRQRSDKAVGSAERRVWRAGATPFPRRLGSAEHSPGNAAPALSRLAASSQGPVPMTESARRIAEALDSMTKQPLMMATPPQAQPGPPPTESLAAFPSTPDSSQTPSAPQRKPLLLGPSAAGTPQGAPADLAARQPAKPLGGLWGLSGPDSQQPAQNAGANVTGGWGSYTHPVAAASGPPSASAGAPSWGQAPASLPIFGRASEPSGQQENAETPKFKFRPSRPLTDSTERLRQGQQKQREAGSGPEAVAQAGKPGPEPVPGNAAALNAKAEAAAAQPLPDSDESDGDDALDGVKGIMRREPPKENGAIATQKPVEDSKSAAPAADGWGADFLKQNAAAQASQSADIAKEIAKKQGRAPQPARSSPAASPQGLGKDNEAEGAPSRPEPAAVGGWGADFLKKNKESEAQANAAVAAAIEKNKGPTTAAPASTPWTFGNQAAQPQAASSSSGLLGFLSGITPVSGASGFAPSTSSGSGLGAGPATDAAAMPTSSAAAFPAFSLPSGAPTFGQPAVQEEGTGLKQDGPVKKRGRAGGEADANGAPASKAFNFGLPAPAASGPAPDGAKASSGLDMLGSTPAFGTGLPFSFGAAPAKPAGGSTDAKEGQPDTEQAPADPTSAPGSSQAASLAMPAFLGFGAQPVDEATGGKLDPAAKPFTLSFGAGGLPSFGAKSQQDDGKQKAEAPASSGAAAGLPLSEDISGRSIDSNMSISPVAGSAAANINPFTAVDEVAPQAASSGPTPPALFPPPASAAQAATPAVSSAPAGDASVKPILFAAAGPSGGRSMPAFGISGPSFGASTSAPLFGAAASTPLFGQATGSALGTPASGLGKGPSSSAAFGVGSSAGAPFGVQSSGALFGANAASMSALSTAPASSAAGFTFGSSGPLTFGAQSSAGPGGAGAAVPAFGAQPLNTGTGEAGQQPPVGQFAFGSAAHSSLQGAAAPAFGGGLAPFGGASAPAFGLAAPLAAFGASAASAPAFGVASAPAFGAASGAAPAFGGASAAASGFGGLPSFGAQSTPAFGAASAPAFGAASGASPGTGFAFGGAFGAGQKQDGQAQPAFGGMQNQPTFGQPSAVPTFGAQPSGQPANPFGQPVVPAFGLSAAQQQQAQPGTGNGGFSAPGSGLANNSAGSMTLGLGEQKQGGANLARRRFKAKRPNK